MIKRKHTKQNRFKRMILKLLKVHAFDKETFNFLNPNFDNKGKNYYSFNDKTYILSNGFLDLKRKINSLDIFFRYCPSVDLWNSSGNWKRIIPGINKEILIKVCLISIKESLLNFLNNYNLKITLHLIHDNSSKKFNDDLLVLLKNNKFDIKIKETKINGNRGTFLECCDEAKNANDLIFFVEDDYLFEKNCLEEILFSYSRISTILDQDIFICPSDYPFFYDSAYKTSLFIGKDHRWRFVEETLLTFLFSKNLLKNYDKNIRSVGENINEPFEKPIDLIYKKIPCLAPVKSTCHHLSRTVPAISENWIELWNLNFKKLK